MIPERGYNYFVLDSTGRTFNVQSFSSNLGIASNLPIVDGALACHCSYSDEVYILVIRKVLHVPLMYHSLILPFIIRSGGVVINDVPEIHCEDRAVKNYCVLFDQHDLRIRLQLNGVFSCFHKRVPTEREIHECEKLFLTPYSSDYNPHCQYYEINE